MTESPELHRLNTQPVTTKCDLEGCMGCNICKYIASPMASSQVRRTSEVSPGLSYAEAVTGSPRGTPSQTGDSSTGTTRGHLSDDVTPDLSAICDNLSFQVEDVINEEVPEPTQRSISTITEPFINTNKRQKWTIEDKLELHKCYCEATFKGLTSTEGTYTIWRNKHPTDRPNMNAIKLSNQRRIGEKILTQSEKENIMREVTQNETLEHTEIDGEVSETAPDTTGILQSLNEGELENDEEVDFCDGELKMRDELTVMYNRIKNEEFDKRARPNKFKMDKENRDKLESMNKILTIFVEEEIDMGIDELNALHYSAAVILAGTQT